MIPPIKPLGPPVLSPLTQTRPDAGTPVVAASAMEARSEAPAGTATAPPVVGPPPTFDITLLEHLHRAATDPAAAADDIAPPARNTVEAVVPEIAAAAPAETETSEDG